MPTLGAVEGILAEDLSRIDPPLRSKLASAIVLLESVGREIGIQLTVPTALAQLDAPSGFRQWIAQEYKRRASRPNFFAQELFGEPCWDMLLDLASATLDNKNVSVSSSCFASGVPQSTALRWLRLMEERGLVVRQADSHDKRKSYIRMSDAGMQTLEAYYRRCILTD